MSCAPLFRYGIVDHPVLFYQNWLSYVQNATVAVISNHDPYWG